MRCKRLAHPVVQGEHLGAVFLAPDLIGLLAEDFLQPGKAAGLGELQQIRFGDRKILHKFVVALNFGVVAVRRQDTGDHAGYTACTEIFQHTDALVALLHIKTPQIFIAADGVTDALLHMGDAKADPLGAELGFHIQQRHKVGGKRPGAPLGLGADQEIHRDIHQPQGHLGIDPGGTLQDVVQHRQIGRLPPQNFFAVIALPHFLGFCVFVHCLGTGHWQIGSFQLLTCSALGYTLNIRSLS